jgi:hypothetical protein
VGLEQLIEAVRHQPDQAAAIAGDEVAYFRPQLVARHDADVAADVGDDGADGPATDLGGDLLGRRQSDQQGVWCVGGRGVAARAGRSWRQPAVRRGLGSASRRGVSRMSLASSASARGRPRAMVRRTRAMSLGLNVGWLWRSVVAICLP